MNSTIVYSHGFGTRADARGMFTDIAASLSGRNHIQFDYNEIIDEKTLRAASLSDQVKKLSELFSRIDPAQLPIDLIAHSQGGVIAAMVKPKVVRRAVFIAPPPEFDVDYSISKFSSRSGSIVDLEGESVMQRSDGSTTLVPASYWKSIRGLDPIPLYNDFAKMTELIIIAGNQDDVFRDNTFHDLNKDIRVTYIDGDHNFRNKYRKGLIQKIKEIFGEES